MFSTLEPSEAIISSEIHLLTLPLPAKDVANKLGMEYKEEDLKNPEINIKLGVKYF